METIKFDPNIAELQAIVAATSKVTYNDLSNDTQLALVHDTRISLRDARVQIEKTGKALRADALKYQKDVIAREKELLAIITPEEDRLTAIEQQAASIRERAARAALLPMRKEQLAPFGAPTITDESILDMDNDQFVTYLVQRQAQKNEQDRLEIEAEKARIADEARLAQIKENAKIEERNRIEAASKADEGRRIQEVAQAKYDAERAAQKLIDDAKIEADRVLREANDKIMQEQAQKEAAEREERIQKEKLEADKRYQAWLAEIGWKEEEDYLWMLERDPKSGAVYAYKFVATFTK